MVHIGMGWQPVLPLKPKWALTALANKLNAISQDPPRVGPPGMADPHFNRPL